jgi:hypothetical protein
MKAWIIPPVIIPLALAISVLVIILIRAFW